MKSKEEIKREIELLKDYVDSLKQLHENSQINYDEFQRSMNIALGSLHTLEWILGEGDNE